MKRFRTSFAAIVAVGLTATAVASALPAKAVRPSKSVAFTAKYGGTASTKVDGNVATIATNGTGSGTLIGAGSLTGGGTADTSQQPCVPFGGTGSLTGAKGAISFKVAPTSLGCGDDGGHVFSLKGTATVLKATGALAKATGSLRFTGIYDRDDGTFSVKFTGTLKR